MAFETTGRLLTVYVYCLDSSAASSFWCSTPISSSWSLLSLSQTLWHNLARLTEILS